LFKTLKPYIEKQYVTDESKGKRTQARFSESPLNLAFAVVRLSAFHYKKYKSEM
jgi:hypothetical protein